MKKEFTSYDELHITLNQCLTCAKFDECKIIDRVMQNHEGYPFQTPEEWVPSERTHEGIIVTVSQCMVYEKGENMRKRKRGHVHFKVKTGDYVWIPKPQDT